MLILVYKYAEGTEHFAYLHTGISKQLPYWSDKYRQPNISMLYWNYERDIAIHK
jgi:hypothetical protein